MKSIEKSIVIHAPVRRVYDQWMRFEDYQQFMPGQVAVQRLGRRDVLWNARICGVRTKWRTVIDEAIPDELIAWHGTVRHPQDGTILFKSVGQHMTQVQITLEYHTRGWLAKALDFAGLIPFLVDSTMRRFQRYIEADAYETDSEMGRLPLANLQTHAAC